METEPRWKEVASSLSASASGPTSRQLELAKFLKIRVVDEKTPAPVAAILLRRALSETLRTNVRLFEPSDGAIEYLADLAKSVRRRPPTSVDSELLDAWLEVFWGLRSAAALRQQKPNVGDIVEKRPIGGLFVISSIGETGRIHFRGGPGQRAWPTGVKVICRVGRVGYERLKYRAEQEAASHHDGQSVPGSEALKSLDRWAVHGTPGDAARLAFEQALDLADDEKPMQKVLQEHPEILGHLIPGTHGTWVIPQKSLGGQLYPDFLIAHLTSAGLQWVLVELESPHAPLTIKDGQAEARVRKGMKQITDWREWLSENIDYARKTENGLGLLRIRADAPGLVIVGRGTPTANVEPMRARALSENRIEVHTYDWLNRAMRTSRKAGYGQLHREFARHDI